MASFQRRTFGTIVDDPSVGTVSWNSPTNAGAEDNAYAEASVLVGNGQTHYLLCTNSSYLDGTTLNVGDTINFISWGVARYNPGSSNIRDYLLYEVEGGVIKTANNYADTATDWGATDTDLATGHTQTMNLPTAAAILASDWGMAFAAQNTDGGMDGIARVDFLYAYIDFTPAGGTPSRVGTFILQAVKRAANYCFSLFRSILDPGVLAT